MSGLKISELQQPILSADKLLKANDLIPIARLSSTGEVTFALPGISFTNNLSSIGTGRTLYAGKQFDNTSGYYYPIKTLSAAAPLLIVDDGSTLTLNLSGIITSAIAGLTPIKSTFVGTGAQTYFNLPTTTLPADPAGYRVDINGVLQEPGVDYSIVATSSPFQIRFTTAPGSGEKIVVIAFAPSVSNSNITPIIPSNSVLLNNSFVTTNATGLVLNQDQVLCNTSFSSIGLSGVSVVNPNEFLGNIGSGIQAVNLSKWKTITTNYSIVSSDFSNTLALSSNSAVTLTIPHNNFNAGFQATIIQLGTGTVTFSPSAGAPGTPSGTGVILNQAYSLSRLSSRWSAATIIYSGTPSIGWTVFGDLA